LDAEGAILIVDLDEGQLIERDISASHLALYRYIVHQTATELTATGTGMIPYIDDEQRTVFFVAGDNPADVLSRCNQLYAELSKSILEMTKLQLWGAYGSPEMDVLQLNLSYRRACLAMKHHLFLEPGEDLGLWIGDAELDAKGQRLDRAIAALHAAKAEDQDRQLHLALQAMVRELEPIDRRKLLLLGSYMVKSLKSDVPEELRAERTAAALQRLRQETFPGSDGYESSKAVSLYRSLLECLYTEAHPSGVSAKQEASEHEIITQVKSYILENFHEPLSLAHIAERIGLSYSYLSSLFHQNTHESYIKFLTRVRMEHAAALLRQQPAEKVYDVAERVGYLSVKHFSYVFKQHFGLPPGQYQEKSLR
jgi:two-component system response regulator YesN